MSHVHVHSASARRVHAARRRAHARAASGDGARAVAAPPSLLRAQVVRGAAPAQGASKVQRLADVRGLVIVPDVVNGRQISQAEFDAACAAIAALPSADVARVAAAGVKLHLMPEAGLGDGLLGATKIVQAGGKWVPIEIHVAAEAGLPGSESLPEIVQHEFGHAISVLKSQNRTEDAAIAYAAKH